MRWLIMTELNPLDRIQELCDERNWSYYQLAKVSGIAYSTLSTMINKHNMPSLPTLQKLCSGFGISITDFLIQETAAKGLLLTRHSVWNFLLHWVRRTKLWRSPIWRDCQKPYKTIQILHLRAAMLLAALFCLSPKQSHNFSKFSPPFIVFFCHFRTKTRNLWA